MHTSSADDGIVLYTTVGWGALRCGRGPGRRRRRRRAAAAAADLHDASDPAMPLDMTDRLKFYYVLLLLHRNLTNSTNARELHRSWSSCVVQASVV
jgi:hypothetical protein